MDNFEVEDALRSARLICDTREQENKRLRYRLHQSNLPIVRRKLQFGDYTIECDALSLEGSVLIERKKDLDELAMCFGRERGRFEREIRGAYEAGQTIYLLIENATWGMLYDDMGYKMNCRSKLPRQSIVASLRSWQVKYGWHIDFVQENQSGAVIRDILMRELKIALENLGDES